MTAEHLTQLMLDVSRLGLLLLAGKLLRVKVPLFRRLYLPSAVIAGLLGLLLGPQVLGHAGVEIVSAELQGAWALYPGRLINVVFACLFLGVALPSWKEVRQEGGPQFCYGWVVGMGQYLIGLLLCVLLLTPLFGVPPFFGCLLEIGFSGGHGTAAGMRGTFETLGFSSGADLGLMSATFGIVFSVVFGMALIQAAVRKGVTRVLRDDDDATGKRTDGLLSEHERMPAAVHTISPLSLESFSFHLAFVGAAIFIGYGILLGIRALSAQMEPDLFRSFPLFPLAMLGGLFLQAAAEKLGPARYLDRGTFERILGVALDFLVVAAVASVRLDVIASYFLPFVILMGVGLAWMLWATWFLAPRMLPDAWFERGIAEFGMQTGVTAMGLLLLRVVDPHYETPAAKSFGFKQMIYEPLLGGGFITASAPLIIVHYGVGTATAVAAATMVIALLPSLFSGRLLRLRNHGQ